MTEAPSSFELHGSDVGVGNNTRDTSIAKKVDRKDIKGRGVCRSLVVMIRGSRKGSS